MKYEHLIQTALTACLDRDVPEEALPQAVNLQARYMAHDWPE